MITFLLVIAVAWLIWRVVRVDEMVNAYVYLAGIVALWGVILLVKLGALALAALALAAVVSGHGQTSDDLMKFIVLGSGTWAVVILVRAIGRLRSAFQWLAAQSPTTASPSAPPAPAGPESSAKYPSWPSPADVTPQIPPSLRPSASASTVVPRSLLPTPASVLDALTLPPLDTDPPSASPSPDAPPSPLHSPPAADSTVPTEAEVWAQIQEALQRLEVLERREAMRLVTRAQRAR